MATTLDFKDIIDIPEWRPLSVAVGSSAAGVCLTSDIRNNEDRNPFLYLLRNATALDRYSIKNDDWQALSSPALTGTFGAGACCAFMPSWGPRGDLAAGCTTTSLVLSTALPATVGLNQLANRGDGVGYKIRIMGNAGAGSSGLTEERYIVANTAGTTPTLILDSPLSFTPASGDDYEILSGRVLLLSAGTTAAGCWKYYDVATNSMSGNLSFTNLPATIATDSAIMVLDETHVPYNRAPGEGFFGVLTSTGMAATTLTGQAAAGDAAVLANEYRNFMIRITEDTTNKTAVGQRALIGSHTAGASPVYTLKNSASWTVTPSVGAKYVIENPNHVLLFTSGVVTTFTYQPITEIGCSMAADANWNTSYFAARGNAVGAGVMAEQAFSIVPESAKNVRHSFIFSFRGGNSSALDILDLAGAATGSWTNTASYGGLSTNVTFTTGSCGAHAAATQEGRYMFINHNGTQRFLRFDMKNNILEPWGYLRYSQGAAVVGRKLAALPFIDGATKLSFLHCLRNTGTEFFQMAINR